MPDESSQDSNSFVKAGTSVEAILDQKVIDRLEMRILLMHVLGLSRAQLITQSHRILSAVEAQQLAQLFQRRIDGEPIAYIIGEREFYGMSFWVSPDVLIPRPDTELLVELALAKLPSGGSLLDMGTGSGAIAVAVAASRADAKVTALDCSNDALAIAQRNATRHAVQVQFLHSDWYAAVTARHFDVIVANPPYIPEHDSHLTQGDLRFEPISALTDHADGLSALRIISAGAPRHLIRGGWLLMEHGYDQSAAVRTLLMEHGFSAVQSWRDLAGIERVSGGQFTA